MEVPPTDDSSQPVEVAEHIPWAELAAPPQKERSWVVYVAAGAIAVAALGALAARSTGTTPEPAPTTVTAAAPAPVVTTLPQSSPDPLTEADLLAVAPGQGEMTAAARAEWFVTDYFSTGGDPGSERQVLDALPVGSRMPAAPQPGSASYVDWAATST